MLDDKPLCQFCGKPTPQPWSAINRALKDGKPIYCNKECAGMARRKGKTAAQKKEEKRLYDAKRRQDLAAEIKVRKAEYHKRTYDPIKAAEQRKKRMPAHVEYCRRPEYKAWKREYDQQYLARKQYGEFGPAVVVLRQIEREVVERIERTDIYATNGTLNKKQTRRRDYERSYSNQP